jgi:hypothetical protein
VFEAPNFELMRKALQPTRLAANSLAASKESLLVQAGIQPSDWVLSGDCANVGSLQLLKKLIRTLDKTPEPFAQPIAAPLVIQASRNGVMIAGCFFLPLRFGPQHGRSVWTMGGKIRKFDSDIQTCYRHLA